MKKLALFTIATLFIVSSVQAASKTKSRKVASAENECECVKADQKCDNSFQRLNLAGFGSDKIVAEVADIDYEVSEKITYNKVKNSASIYKPKSKKMQAYNGTAPVLVIESDFTNAEGGTAHLIDGGVAQYYECAGDGSKGKGKSKPKSKSNADDSDEETPKKKTGKTLTVTCGKLKLVSNVENASTPQTITSFTYDGVEVPVKDNSETPYDFDNLQLNLNFGKPLYSSAEITVAKCDGDGFKSSGKAHIKEHSANTWGGSKPSYPSCSCSLQ